MKLEISTTGRIFPILYTGPLVAIRCDTIRDAILTCAQIYRTEPTTSKWKKENVISKKTDVLRSISKQSVESAESVLKKKRTAITVGRIAGKEGFKRGMKE